MTTPQPPAVRLRAAAALVRERAGAATPGPWTATELPPNAHHRPAHWVTTEYADGDATVSATVADCPWRQADASWIALMGPAVGEPLATWLDGEAARWDPEAGIQSWDASHERALAVADALLAVTS